MKYLSLLLFLFLLMSCSNPIGSFEGNIELIKPNMMLVDCSSAVNRGKEGAIEARGYFCNVEIQKILLSRVKMANK